jgi:hypothetical protein
MSWDELELILLLSPGDSMEVRDKLTGHSWRGTVDSTAPRLASFGCLLNWENGNSSMLTFTRSRNWLTGDPPKVTPNQLGVLTNFATGSV